MIFKDTDIVARVMSKVSSALRSKDIGWNLIWVSMQLVLLTSLFIFLYLVVCPLYISIFFLYFDVYLVARCMWNQCRLFCFHERRLENFDHFLLYAITLIITTGCGSWQVCCTHLAGLYCSPVWFLTMPCRPRSKHAASSGFLASPNPIAAIPFARASGKGLL